MTESTFNLMMLSTLVIGVAVLLTLMIVRAASDARFERSYARYRLRQYEARVAFMADRERCKRDARAGAPTDDACDRDERERMST